MNDEEAGAVPRGPAGSQYKLGVCLSDPPLPSSRHHGLSQGGEGPEAGWLLEGRWRPLFRLKFPSRVLTAHTGVGLGVGCKIAYVANQNGFEERPAPATTIRAIRVAGATVASGCG